MVPEVGNGRSELVFVVDWDHYPVVFDELRGPSNVGHNHREATCHGFEERIAHSFVPGGEHEGVVVAIDTGELLVIYFTGERDRDAGLPSSGGEGLLLGSGADDSYR